jgi:glycosyltransferase involved in cell wall biosynthesis
VLGDLVTAPYEPYDALICTSQAVLSMVRTVSASYADYLRQRQGGSPSVRLRLETIPLGVNPERFRPPSPEERAAARRALNASDDEVVVLFVGRLSYHAKAHPVPMFLALAQAARATQRKVHLVLAGWGPREVIEQYQQALRTLTPDLRVTVVDGTRPEWRFSVWHAADIFTSLSDNIQETFGLVIIEAMACGLPVLASDWDGYRDLVADGETGYLVPTWMVRDALTNLTSRFLTMGELDYDSFLAECNQAIAVDIPSATAGYARLLAEDDLRRRMGIAGRRRVLERFSWEHVVRAYEALWRSQEADRQAHLRRTGPGAPRSGGPARCPVPEVTFDSYPTGVMGPADAVRSIPGAEALLEQLLQTPMTTYAMHCRLHAAQPLRELLTATAQPRTVAEVDALLIAGGVGLQTARATVAWLLKYGLLGVAGMAEEPAEEAAPPADLHTHTLAAIREVLGQGGPEHPAQSLNRLAILIARYRSILLTGDLVGRCGMVVQGGPFRGLRYVTTSTSGPLLPKLLGCYEAELHPVLDGIVEKQYERVINIGCGEGYYAVGLARRIPQSTVYAFDSSEEARALCVQLATLNEVAERVVVGGTCERAHLRELAGPRTLLLCDCEGGELDLLQPEQVPGLRACDLLVELHDLLDPRITPAIRERFSPTHDITLIAPSGRAGVDHAVLHDRSQLDQLLALWEGRGGPTPWAWMTAREGAR